LGVWLIPIIVFKNLVEEHKRNGFKSMIIWTFRDNKDRNFYEILGGIISEEKSYNFGGSDIPIIAYTWKDISEITF
jgi:hypothetical protein